ncbi:MAG TPA: sensor histidine kinase [Xanthobacteraceae bacterium]
MTALRRELAPSGSELLLAELVHRINNEFTSAVCIISRAAARSESDDVKATLAAVSERLMDYALVHRALQMPTEHAEIDASAFLRGLCAAISRSKLADLGIEMSFVDRPLRMDSRRCWLLGLVVCELVNNAARHAFNGAAGTIRVELRLRGSFVECSVSDNGRSSAPIRPGRGFAIVEALAETLDGNITRIMGNRGSAVVLTFPHRADVRSRRRETIDNLAVTLN